MAYRMFFRLAALSAAGFALLLSSAASAQSTNDGWQDLDALLGNSAPERSASSGPASSGNDGWVDLEDFEGNLPSTGGEKNDGWQDIEPTSPSGETGPRSSNESSWRVIDDDIAAASADMILPSSRIAAGDLIDIYVADAESLSGAYRVSTIGTLVLPLIGSVTVSGLEASGVEAELKRLYSIDYLVDPQITVTVREKIIGEVTLSGRINRAGPIPMTSVLSLAQALDEAGGVSGMRTNLDAIILRAIGDTVSARRVALDEISPSNLPGPTLLPGDQINILERKKFADIKNEGGQFPLLDTVLGGGTLSNF